MTKKIVIRFVAIIILCMAVGSIGAIFTSSSVSTWYANLNKPSFTPPDHIFGIVWPILYVMMGASAAIIAGKGLQYPDVRFAFVVFIMQLILNGLWTPLFFGLNCIAAALFEIILLWLAVVITITLFAKISKLAAALLIPYIFWLSFAVVLNAAFYILNK